ncbi:MAG TPA: hypothetical protein VF170_17905, partial [Planctomycetaceae bacterium]
RRDGCPDTWGWVADIVNLGAGKPQEMLCPGSELSGSEKLNDMVGAVNTSNADQCPPSRLVQGVCANWGSGTPDTLARIEQVGKLLTDGYGTNYATSWYLVRSGPKVNAANQTIAGLKGLGGTLGPLRQRQLENSGLSSQVVPWIGCGAPGDAREAVLTMTAAQSLYDPASGQEYAPVGARLAETANDGPAYWDGSKLVLMPAGTPVVGPGGGPPVGPNGEPYLQDTRDWYAWHGLGKKKTVNILMADGSVKSFADQDGDQFLNPGHAATTGNADTDGYTSDVVELPPAEIFSGPFLPQNAVKKGNFES